MTPTDCDADTVRALLRFCYLGKLGAVTEAQLDSLYLASLFLGIKQLGTMCLSYKQRLKRLVCAKAPLDETAPDESITGESAQDEERTDDWLKDETPLDVSPTESQSIDALIENNEIVEFPETPTGIANVNTSRRASKRSVASPEDLHVVIENAPVQSSTSGTLS